jgi:membrane protein DedA with SNARE-associated domain
VPEPSTGIYSYAGVFAALVLAAFGFPIPEEIPVVVAGGLCARAASGNDHGPAEEMPFALGLPLPEAVGPAAAIAAADAPARTARSRIRHPVWYIMLPVCILGVVLCDAILYTIGRAGGPRLLEVGWVKRFLIRPDTRDRIESNFHRYGVRILLGVRLLPGVRAPVFVMAGVLRLPVTRFLLADGLYAIVGVTILFVLAYWFTDQVTRAILNFTHQVDSIRPYVITGAIAAVGLFFIYEFWKRRRVTGDPKEVPIIGEKLIKPSETDEFPDSVLLPKTGAERSEPRRMPREKDEATDQHR